MKILRTDDDMVWSTWPWLRTRHFEQYFVNAHENLVFGGLDELIRWVE
jgi:hypothetical protein